MAASQNQDSNFYNIWRSLLKMTADKTRTDLDFYKNASQEISIYVLVTLWILTSFIGLSCGNVFKKCGENMADKVFVSA